MPPDAPVTTTALIPQNLAREEHGERRDHHEAALDHRQQPGERRPASRPRSFRRLRRGAPATSTRRPIPPPQTGTARSQRASRSGYLERSRASTPNGTATSAAKSPAAKTTIQPLTPVGGSDREPRPPRRGSGRPPRPASRRRPPFAARSPTRSHGPAHRAPPISRARVRCRSSSATSNFVWSAAIRSFSGPTARLDDLDRPVRVEVCPPDAE